MTSDGLRYTVDDRSILLPYYKRFFVQPFLRFIPDRLNPNTITHVGHLLNLLAVVILIGLWPKGGWPYAASALLLHLYCWCDNADGAHARRTNQCSALGEFLDHGLDQLNTVYIGYLTAASLGSSPTWWVVIALIIPGAAVFTYWEQATTGVFRVGLLNQVESVLVLSSALIASAIFGVDVFQRVSFAGITLQHAALGWCAITILFGMMRGIQRVGAHGGWGAVLPIVPFVAFGAAVFGAAMVGALSTVGAVAIATGGTIYFGMAMLTNRLHGKRPHFDMQLLVGALVGGGLIVWRLFGQPLNPLTGPVLVGLACSSYGALAVLAARSSVNHIGRMAQAPPAEA